MTENNDSNLAALVINSNEPLNIIIKKIISVTLRLVMDEKNISGIFKGDTGDFSVYLKLPAITSVCPLSSLKIRSNAPAGHIYVNTQAKKIKDKSII